MIFLKAVGWLILLIPLTILLYNMPLSLLTAAYSKVRHGQIVHYPKMPFLLIALGIGATWLIAGLLIVAFNADPQPLQYAAGTWSVLYLVFNY